MPGHRKILVLAVSVLLTGCIEEFVPKIEETQNALVVNGTITDQEGYQYVEISRTSSYSKPTHLPERDCIIEVSDSMGNSFRYDEYSSGKYRCYIEQQYLAVGNMYKLNIKIRNGKEYASDYETILPCPPVKDLYYEVQKVETRDPYLTYYGIQFFVDVDGIGTTDNYFRWKMEETWEYHAQHLITHYYDNGMIDAYSYTDNIWECWGTRPVPMVFTKSTTDLNENNLRKVPLNYVSNQTERLKIRYSLLVKQYSLSRKAFNYWNELKLQSQETGGLYEGQPVTISGNIYNSSDSDEIVLGYFDASAVQEKRILVENTFDFWIFNSTCLYDTLTVGQLVERFGANPAEPILLHIIPVGNEIRYGYTHQPCFDCTLDFGTNTKPDFWD